jgi:UDP-N-acetylglucosamine transferase subunit ALG13
MILLTVGTQLPFDRLVKAVDEMSPRLTEKVYAQIGETTYAPRHIEWTRTIRPEDFDKRFRDARVVVAHAGIGTILTAQKHGKPIILFPRRSAFGEHRNDHQLATCAQVKGREGVYVADDEAALERLLNDPSLAPAPPVSNHPGRSAIAERLTLFVRGE